MSEVLALLKQTVAERLRPANNLGPPNVSLSVEAHAWCLLSFWQYAELRPLLDQSSGQLAKAQLADGRVPIDPRFPEVAWPTALAVLAWMQQADRQPQIELAIQFLLQWQGQHFPLANREIMGHDTTLRGWPWITGTHSFIEPTVTTLLALSATGYPIHSRCLEARKMILDRQLSRGGWNFGNTTVFGQELRPMVHSTGMALTALANTETRREQVEGSLRYLEKALATIRSPLSLGWGTLGLTVWNLRPSQLESWIAECLALEKTTTEYSLPMLGLLACVLLAPDQNPLLPPPSQ